MNIVILIATVAVALADADAADSRGWIAPDPLPARFVGPPRDLAPAAPAPPVAPRPSAQAAAPVEFTLVPVLAPGDYRFESPVELGWDSAGVLELRTIGRGAAAYRVSGGVEILWDAGGRVVVRVPAPKESR